MKSFGFQVGLGFGSRGYDVRNEDSSQTSAERASPPSNQVLPRPDKQTWVMNASTIIMPCNESGFTDPLSTVGWGIVDFDWSNAKAVWAAAKPMDCEERLVEQVRRTTAASPTPSAKPAIPAAAATLSPADSATRMKSRRSIAPCSRAVSACATRAADASDDCMNLVNRALPILSLMRRGAIFEAR